MLSLLVAEIVLLYMRPFEKEILENCVSYKKEVSCTWVAQNVDGKEIVGRKVWWPTKCGC